MELNRDAHFPENLLVPHIAENGDKQEQKHPFQHRPQAVEKFAAFLVLLLFLALLLRYPIFRWLLSLN
jgi:hypothetical protein